MQAKWSVLAAMVLAAGAAHADPVKLKDSVPHITTTGSAKAEVVPDQAELRLSVSNERPAADAASQATAEAASAIVANADAKGVAAKDIKTSLDMSARYVSVIDDKGRTTGQKLRGYVAREGISIRVRDVSKVGALARESVSKGATGIEGVEFSFSRQKETLRNLNAEAMRDAMAEAKSYVEAVGSKLGRLLQVGDDPQNDVVADLPSRRAPPVSGSVSAMNFPMQPGTQVLEQSVTATWEIEGKAP